MKTRRSGVVAVALGIAFGLSGCGGGGGGGSSNNTSTTTAGKSTSTVIAGVAVKGPLNGADVEIKEINTGTVLGTGTTRQDDTGRFSITLSRAPVGPISVSASGGSYTSEYDSGVVTSSSYAITAVFGSVPAGGLSSVSVTPLSDMAAVRAASLVKSGMSASAALAQADQEVASFFGLSTAPETVQPHFDPATLTGKSDASAMALALFALDTFGHGRFPADPDAIYEQLSNDFSDGRLDASGAGYTVDYGKSYAGASQLHAELFTSLITSVGAYANNVSPQATVSWAQANPAQALQDGVAPNPPGYSCPSSTNPYLMFDGTGKAVCWNGMTDTNGNPYLGTYYICGDGSLVANESSCTSGGMIQQDTTTLIAYYTAPVIGQYQAQLVKPFTAADLAAMNATLFSSLPSWASQSTPLTSGQMSWINSETDAMGAAWSM